MTSCYGYYIDHLNVGLPLHKYLALPKLHLLEASQANLVAIHL